MNFNGRNLLKKSPNNVVIPGCTDYIEYMEATQNKGEDSMKAINVKQNIVAVKNLCPEFNEWDIKYLTVKQEQVNRKNEIRELQARIDKIRAEARGASRQMEFLRGEVDSIRDLEEVLEVLNGEGWSE